MRQIYLDNASTSFPKAPGVAAAMAEYIEQVGVNVSRGGYAPAYSAAERVLETRERLAAMFGVPKPQNVIFCAGVTMALNLVMLGLLKSGDHVLVSGMEHNAVMRPLALLARRGVLFDCVPCGLRGEMQPDQLEGMIRPNTRAVIMTHASNVCGTLLPVEAVAQICRRHNIRLIVDAAQSAGVVPISLSGMGIDALAIPGHKGLLGPPGIGCLLLSEAFAAELDPVMAGGTGSRSDSQRTPDFLPEKFEPGTPNLPGIYGLCAALKFLAQRGTDGIRRHEALLTRRFLRGLDTIPAVRPVGMPDSEGRVAVISVEFLRQDNATAAFALESEYGVLTRCGLQCAPSAHRTLKTFPQGTVRFSFGHATTEQEVEAALYAIAAVAR